MVKLESKFLQFHKYGAPYDVLEFSKEEFDSDKIKPTEVVIKVIYACIHPSDCACIAGILKVL